MSLPMSTDGCCGRRYQAHSRREFLTRSALGLGAIPLASLQAAQNPLAPKRTHFPAKARNMILLFMQGGPSHVDTFDPKPALTKYDGQPIPPEFPDGRNQSAIHQSERLEADGIAAPVSKMRRFRPGNFGPVSNIWVLTWTTWPSCARAITTLLSTGLPSTCSITGRFAWDFRSVGSWLLYGLGSECDNLPAFLVMSDGGISGRSRNSFSSGFLPAIYQGTLLRTEGSPLINLSPPDEITRDDQRAMLDQVQQWNQRHLAGREDDSRLAAQIANYELAFRMQMAAPDLVDLSKEPENIQKLYGLDQKPTEKFGRMCLLARRMVERGVRFVQLISTDWDGHAECDKNHVENARKTDKPIAGLIADLKQRGLLESTLIAWVGEFGRTPVMQGKEGRDHHPYGFSAWFAGGGVRGGKIIGATDDLGFRAVEDRVHVHDLHATILALLGLDHLKLTYFFQGRDFRLTDVHGESNFASRLLRG